MYHCVLCWEQRSEITEGLDPVHIQISSRNNINIVENRMMYQLKMCRVTKLCCMFQKR